MNPRGCKNDILPQEMFIGVKLLHAMGAMFDIPRKAQNAVKKIALNRMGSDRL